MSGTDHSSRLRGFLSMLPVIGLALIPRLTCVCQIPAYAGLIGSMGLAFLLESVYQLPLTAGFLTLAVGGLAIRARQRRGYSPVFLGTVAALVLLIGKFAYASQPAVYAGIVLLLAASLWNSWPVPAKPKLRFTPEGRVERSG